jgi:hypothetical protein
LTSLALMGSATLSTMQEIVPAVFAGHKLAVKIASCGVAVGEAFAGETTSSKNVMHNNLLTLRSELSRFRAFTFCSYIYKVRAKITLLSHIFLRKQPSLGLLLGRIPPY